MYSTTAATVKPQCASSSQPNKIDFLTFVKGCIRNIRYDWNRDGRDFEPVDMLVTPPNQQAQAEASITLNKARDCLRGHIHAVEIFDLMREGHTGPEIQEQLKITQSEYAAAYKWIFRTLGSAGDRRQ